MITVFCYNGKELKKKNIEDIEKIDLSKKEKEKKWIIITNINKSEAELLSKKTNLHPTTIEDFLSLNARIKYEEQEDYTLIIFREIKKICSSNIKTEKISVIFGESVIITVYDKENQKIENLIKNQEKIKYLFSKNIHFIGYYILDKEVDQITDSKSLIIEDFKQLEKKFVEKPDKEILRKFFDFELLLLNLRQISESTTDLSMNLITPTDNYIDNELIPYFKDVYDHTFKTTESLKSMLGRINGMRSFYQSIISNKINDTMRILTIIMAIMMTITIITGFYGMNIKLPFQDKSYAYFLILILITLTAIITYFIARRMGKTKEEGFY